MLTKDIIKTGRERLGMTPQAFADAVGVSRGAVQQWERGTTAPTRKHQPRIAELLGISEAALMHPDDNTIDVQSRWVDEPMAIQAPDASVSKFDADTVHIPYYDTGGAMGHGIVLRDQPGVIREMSVSKEWLQSNVRGYTNAENLCLVTGFGDSMRPLFMSGDPVIVDKGVTEFRGDGLYFFRVDGEGFIKRLQSIPGRGLVVISENPSYEKWSIDGATTDFQVLGKVIKAWCGCDF